MNIYKVGGCVRDFILGYTPKDTDYVVVGSSTAEMVSLGYKQVGADFPVFLHPDTGDEYALARKEISTGDSYTDFTFGVDNVTLEDDLIRRDLTINSIAMDDNGHIYDPANGMSDCYHKILRHTSDAFREDPVRVLRIGRFLARLGPSWRVDDSTAALCTDMFKTGMTLHPDRVWKEFSRALQEPYWELFIEWLIRVGNVIPELDWATYNRDLSSFTLLEYKLSHVCLELPQNKVEGFLSNIGAPKDYRKLASTLNGYRLALMESPSRYTPETIYGMYIALRGCKLLGDYFIQDVNHDSDWVILFDTIQWDRDRDYLVKTMSPGIDLGLAIRDSNIGLIEEFLNARDS